MTLEEGEEEFKEISRLTNLIMLFEGLDIPFLDNTPDSLYEIAKEESN